MSPVAKETMECQRFGNKSLSSCTIFSKSLKLLDTQLPRLLSRNSSGASMAGWLSRSMSLSPREQTDSSYAFETKVTGFSKGGW